MTVCGAVSIFERIAEEVLGDLVLQRRCVGPEKRVARLGDFAGSRTGVMVRTICFAVAC